MAADGDGEAKLSKSQRALASRLRERMAESLLPGETAALCLTGAVPEGTRARFEIRREGHLLARGVVEGAT